MSGMKKKETLDNEVLLSFKHFIFEIPFNNCRAICCDQLKNNFNQISSSLVLIKRNKTAISVKPN